MTRPTRDAVRITLIYFIASASWIAFSDTVTAHLFAPETAARLQTLKGLAFVFVTALLLLWGMRRSFTREHMAHGAFNESQHRWRELVENTTDAVVILDGRRIIYANAAAAALIGSDDPSLPIDREIDSFLVSGNLNRVERRIEEVARGRHVPSPRFRIRRLDGAERTIEAHSTSIKFYDHPVVLSILVDVTEQLEQRALLLRAKDEAEQLAQMRTTILNNMSHEIRTPLTGIVGISELLVDEVSGEARELAFLLHESGWRLMRTLESILTLAQLDSDNVKIEPEPLDLRRMVTAIARTFEPQAAKKNIRLNVAAPDRPVYANVDVAAIDQVVMNLVSNAIKFTDSGSVNVRTGLTDGFAFVAVEDTGIGIGPSFLPHLFEEYQQESQGLTRQYEGSGLGLAISKRLVERMHGQIHVQSEKGRGTRVEVVIPQPSTADRNALAHM